MEALSAEPASVSTDQPLAEPAVEPNGPHAQPATEPGATAVEPAAQTENSAAPTPAPPDESQPKAAPRRQIGTADFDIQDQLGEGSFGQVCLCTLTSTGVQYAVKIIEIIHARKHGGLEQVRNERNVLILLDHPSVVKLQFSFQDAEHLYMVLELASGGELFSHIKRLGACHINCARWLTGELVNVLEYMHSKGVVHRDLKPENILLDDLGHIKLVDFGSSRRLDVEDKTPQFAGTALYVSPEVIDNRDAEPSADMWALGCIVFQMLSGSPPFAADSEYLIFKRIEKCEYEFPEHFHHHARGLVEALLQLHPPARPAADDAIKAHPFFQQCEAPLDFPSLHTTPPPPLVPPPPAPLLAGDSIINSSLAEHSLQLADRRDLVQRQRHSRWAALVGPDEVIVLATAILKRRHLSVKRRHLVLCDCVDGCRLIYVDPDSMEVKGTIPWSAELNAELMPRGCFRVHVPGRTYYMEDLQGKQETAELWVRTLLKLRARLDTGENTSPPTTSPRARSKGRLSALGSKKDSLASLGSGKLSEDSRSGGSRGGSPAPQQPRNDSPSLYTGSL